MAITYKSGSFFSVEDNNSTFSVTGGTGLDPGAGSNRILVVVNHTEGPGLISTVTWNGSSMTVPTPLIATTGTQRVQVHIFEDSQFAAASGELVVGFASSVRRRVSCAIFEGVDQTTPAGTEVTDITAGTAGTAPITIPSGGAGIAALTLADITDVGGVTWGTNWVELDDSSAVSFATGFAYSLTAGSTDPAPTWTTSQENALIAIPLNAAASSGPVITNDTVTSETTDGFTLNFETNTANGTAYYVVYADGTAAPDATQIQNGQDGTGAAALASGNMAINSTGAQAFPAITGLTPGTVYDYSIVHYGNP